MPESKASEVDEMNFFSFFYSSSDLLFVFNESGIIIEANRTATEKLQYRQQELLGKSIYSLHPNERREEAEVYLQEILDLKRSCCPIPFITRRGELLYVETNISRGRWNGKPAIFSLSKDLTDRMKTEDLLRKSEEKYRKIFENIQDIFYQTDVEGRILEISPSIERYSGYKPEELIGKRVEDVYLDPADRTELLKVLSSKGEVEDYIVKLKTKTGKEIFTSANIHILLDTDGKVIGVEGSLRDVSERIIAEAKLKENEMLLRRQNEEYAALNQELRWRNEQMQMINKELQQASDIFMNIRTGLHIYHLEDINDDSSLRMIGVNPAGERLMGISARDILGNTIDENFPALREKGIPQAYAEVVRTKVAKQFDELLYSDDRVMEGVFTFNAFPLPDDCVGISFENITEQYKAREVIIESNIKLVEAKEKAEESDRLKSAFLANMSHEIRTPMNGIMGFSMMLADPMLPKETRDSYIRIVNSSCEQLLHIVNDIIDISKIEAGQIDVTESAFDLKILLNEIYTFYSSIAREKGIKLEIDQVISDLKQNSFIISDRTKLRQIFDNLLSNSVKFTPSGKIIIRCELRDGFIRFKVEDTGIGIEPDLQNIIFERFRQVESSYTKSYGGTGLGLAITKAYVEKLGGRISVRSEFGKGSVFTFKLPYKPASDMTIRDKNVSRFRPLDLGLTILVVEDEEINWLYLNEILKNRVKVLRAITGKEAVEVVKQNDNIDIILMDIKLPDINGLELTKIIKSINSRIKVIAQTAYALSGDRESVIAAGCSGYISKPVNRDELLNLILAYSNK
jgi:PAS domain S-box-containing protein